MCIRDSSYFQRFILAETYISRYTHSPRGWRFPLRDPFAEQIRRGRGEVARMMGLMTLHNVEPKAEVGVRELHDQLSRYLHHVSSGAEVVVTCLLYTSDAADDLTRVD